MKWRTERVEAIRADHHSRTFTLTFPKLPDGAVPCHVEMEFDNHESHQPSAYVLTYEVPDADGPQKCAADCPVCGGGE